MIFKSTNDISSAIKQVSGAIASEQKKHANVLQTYADVFSAIQYKDELHISEVIESFGKKVSVHFDEIISEL